MITDVIMPADERQGTLHGNHGSEFPNTEVLFISGYTDDALAHHGVLDEGLWFLEKPFSPARFAQKVRAVLDGDGQGS